MHTKYIFVTGGVVSGLGKGITAASLGRILKSRGLSVTIQKFDPYINVDPGTMSPYQHGEVFVTEDGSETDLDIGHYERFIDENLNRFSNVTTGKVYSSVIKKERRGEYLGHTIQVIPHITNEIKANIYKVGESNKTNIVITEIGGTVGDIESLPFIETIRQVKTEKGFENTLYIHVTLIPYLSKSEEIKTKPTQHSVKELMQAGVVPDIIVCRTGIHLTDEHKSKIALFCNIPKENVFENYDTESIYEVPAILESQGLSDVVCKHLNIECVKSDMREWNDIVAKQRELAKIGTDINITLVGKYTSLKDAYLSISESLKHASIPNDANINIRWVNSETLEREDYKEYFFDVDGIIVPGGFGDRGIEGKINAIRYAREYKIPCFGICLGMQLMAIEYARNVLGLNGAHSTEFNAETEHPIISLIEEQKSINEKGATMRRGAYPCDLLHGSLAYKAYGKDNIKERHRHRYEFNNEYMEQMKKAGLRFSGMYSEKMLVEIIEVENHPWMLGVQFHPEFKSRLNRPHPLFTAFVEHAKKYKLTHNQ